MKSSHCSYILCLSSVLHLVLGKTEHFVVKTVTGVEADKNVSDLQVVEKDSRSNKMRLLILDKTCATLRLTKPEMTYMMVEKLKTKSTSGRINYFHVTKNCWIEMTNWENPPEQVWNPEGILKILIHGYGPWFWDTSDGILKKAYIYDIGEEYGMASRSNNIIAVDWTYLSTTFAYVDAVFATRRAGRELANALVKLVEGKISGEDKWSKIHTVGFSLGAHVAGVTGYHLKTDHNKTLGRITGIDPAGLEFDRQGGKPPTDLSGFLDMRDATFVDIIHCNMGATPNAKAALSYGLFGSWVQAGHADFYPNGGERQFPFCSALDDRSGCSHSFCTQLFMRSIRHPNLLACRCLSWQKFKQGLCPCKNDGEKGVQMGEKCPKTAKGKYFLKTTTVNYVLKKGN